MFNSRVGGRLKEDVDGKHRARENPLPREMTEKFIDSFIFLSLELFSPQSRHRQIEQKTHIQHFYP